MSDLIILGYDNHDAARGAYEKVLSMQRDHVVELTGLAVVTVDEDGKCHVDTPGKVIAGPAAAGALWGTLLGVLFLVPFAGALVGGALGAVMGRLSKTGIDASFRRRVQSMVSPGRAAVVLMATKITEDRFGDGLRPFGGEVLQTSLSHEDERDLAQELNAA
jgi:uncharacterized membrane protein